eukprot:Rmarinus@m.1146
MSFIIVCANYSQDSDVITRAISHLLIRIEETKSAVSIALFPVISPLQLAVKPSTEFSEHRAYLKHLPAWDETPLVNALCSVPTLVTDTSGAPLADTTRPLQVVVLSSASILSDSAAALANCRLAIPCCFHFVSVSPQLKVSNFDGVRLACDALRAPLHVAHGDDAAKAARHAVDSIVEMTCGDAYCHLALGRLCTPITVSPNPQPVFHYYTGLSSGLSMQLPQVLSISGFLPHSVISSPACISRHTVMCSRQPRRIDPSLCKTEPPVDTPAAPVRRSKRIAETAQAALELATRCMKVDDDDESVLLLATLELSLAEEKVAALVYLRPDWVGLLYAHVDELGQSGLLLLLLEPGASLPQLGNPMSLEPRSAFTPEEVAPTTVVGPRPPSYAGVAQDSSAAFPTMQAETVKAEWQRLRRRLRSQTLKRELIVADCERIRVLAFTLALPELLSTVAQLMQHEIQSWRTEPKAKVQIATDALQQLLQCTADAPIV